LQNKSRKLQSAPSLREGLRKGLLLDKWREDKLQVLRIRSLLSIRKKIHLLNAYRENERNYQKGGGDGGRQEKDPIPYN
jgi:hypothetical protein